MSDPKCTICDGSGIDYDSDGRDFIWATPCECQTTPTANEALAAHSYEMWQRTVSSLLHAMVEESDGLKLSHHLADKLRNLRDTPYSKAPSPIRAVHQMESRRILKIFLGDD